MLIFLSPIWVNTIGIFYDIINYFFRNDINRYLLIRPLRDKHKKIIESAFTYYQILSEQNKKLFEKRVRKFIDMKKFFYRGDGGMVTLEMEALIAASAIQLTFGLPGVYFIHFRKIIIYPDDYYSAIYRRYHKGEVNQGLGIIILSWKNFLEGYTNASDGINLGIHEMSHALHLENKILNREYNFLNASVLEQWEKAADKELSKIQEGKSDFFRRYGGLNEFEFFAVAVENFFERPVVFYRYNREMYGLLSKLLNQDPAKKMTL
ncbi:MAG TPA: zinc-dependent peptidase [Cyclobacteriaceae bacterium]|nr:zinc-dependent peptidase [Cyclobacteriaceae bacterium]